MAVTEIFLRYLSDQGLVQERVLCNTGSLVGRLSQLDTAVSLCRPIELDLGSELETAANESRLARRPQEVGVDETVRLCSLSSPLNYWQNVLCGCHGN